MAELCLSQFSKLSSAPSKILLSWGFENLYLSEKMSLTSMGVLDPFQCMLDVVACPLINMSERFSADVSAKSPPNISPTNLAKNKKEAHMKKVQSRTG